MPAAVTAAGTTGGDILKVYTGARPLAVGGAYTAWGTGADSLNYNPAGIGAMEGRELNASYLRYFAETQIANVSFAQQFDSFLLEGKMGLSLMYRWIPTIDNEDAEDEPVDYNESVISFCYANTLDYFIDNEALKNITAGISGKLLTEQIGPHTGSALAFDIGAQYRGGGEGFSAGAALRNIGAGLKLIRGSASESGPSFEESPLPLTFRAGLLQGIRIDDDNFTRLAVDYIQDFYDYARFAAGIEHELIKLLYLRAGYNTSVDTRNPSYLSAGAGIFIEQEEFKIGVNYVYRMALFGGFDIPAHNHSGSVTIKF